MLIGSLRTPHATSLLESLHALDWLNFFLAALLTGFGPVVAIYLADREWPPANIGLVLTVSGLAGLLAQIPASDLIDLAKSKLGLVGTGIAALTFVLLMLGLRPDFPSIFVASVIQGAAGSRELPPSV
jgi:hypothetical protein